MNSINEDLDLLENLSKRISDLIYNNEFSHISLVDAQRRAIIERVKKNDIEKIAIKKRIGNIIEKNVENIKITEEKLKKLSKNHNKINKRLKAYSLIK